MLPPAMLQSLLKGMGVDPVIFKQQMENCFSQVAAFDKRLENIENHLKILIEKGNPHG